VATLFVLAVPAAAEAREATGAEVRQLAGDAVFDDEALRDLRRVDEVDGRAANLDRLLEGASGEEIVQRVDALLQDPGAPAAARDAAADRAEARRIIAQDRYRPDDIPRPFRGPLEWIAQRLEPVGEAITDFYRWVGQLFRTLARGTPGGAATLWTLAGLAVVAAAAAQTNRLIARRNKTRAEGGADDNTRRGDDPRELERRAAAARSRGEHDLAVRLLFRAGLLRLARAQVIPARDSLTTGDVRRLLASPEFDRIGISFDEIAYGRRRATDADSRSARDAWSQLLRTRSG